MINQDVVDLGGTLEHLSESIINMHKFFEMLDAE